MAEDLPTVTLVINGQAGIQVDLGCLQMCALFADATCFACPSAGKLSG